MKINNVTEFATFISTHNLTNGESSLEQVIECLNTYKAACSCWKNEEKLEMYNNCNRIYYHAVKNVIPNLKRQFLAITEERQISFFNDAGQLIGIISH